MTRSVCRYALLLVFSLVFALLVSGQDGPPPEIRGHIDALVKALNSGSSDAWEKMAQEHFSPGELKRRSAEARKQVFENLRRDFGAVSLGGVEGPDQPLQLHVKGSNGASGVIELNLEPSAPYRIDSMGVRIGDSTTTSPIRASLCRR